MKQLWSDLLSLMEEILGPKQRLPARGRIQLKIGNPDKLVKLMAVRPSVQESQTDQMNDANLL